MRKRLIALLLVLALTVSICAVTAVAEEENREGSSVEETVETNTEGVEETVEEPTVSLAGPDPEAEVDPETGELIESVTIVPDEVGTVSFENIERRVRENNLDLLTLEQSIEMLEDVDYEDVEEDLRDALNSIAEQKWNMIMAGSIEPVASSLVIASMEEQYDALREQFDAVRDGDLQEDNAATIRQLKAVQDQLVLAAESTYIALVELEVQEDSLQRQLSALNRTVEEMELRYNMGQISALQLAEVKAGRTSLVSGLATMQMNIKNVKMQLEVLLGAEITGEITLSGVPEVTGEQLASISVETDLEIYKTNSYDVYAAAKTLEDAEETYKDDARDYHYNEKKAEYRNAERTWQAAQYTYNSTMRGYELQFKQLYGQVHDYKQILDAAKVSLECEKASFEASELKYQQGTISYNEYLTAQDDLQAAEETVQTAANDLFSSYNTYCWAVQHGVLN